MFQAFYLACHLRFPMCPFPPSLGFGNTAPFPQLPLHAHLPSSGYWCRSSLEAELLRLSLYIPLLGNLISIFGFSINCVPVTLNSIAPGRISSLCPRTSFWSAILCLSLDVSKVPLLHWAWTGTHAVFSCCHRELCLLAVASRGEGHELPSILGS